MNSQLMRLCSLSFFTFWGCVSSVYAQSPLLIPSLPASHLKVEIAFLPAAREKALAPPSEGMKKIVVSGTYTRADKFAPGGLVIDAGVVANGSPQGWDGILVVSPQGQANLYSKYAVEIKGITYDLTKTAQRKDFIHQAKEQSLSVIQSHMLIINGKTDVQFNPTAPRFQRRLLFQTKQGAIGVYETAKAVTLYEAAEALQQQEQPFMALNLDMGSYDFCETWVDSKVKNCGVVSRRNMEKLTNLIIFTIPNPSK